MGKGKTSNDCHCADICPFYQIFERVTAVRESSEVFKHLSQAQRETLLALRALSQAILKKGKTTKEKIRRIRVK